MTQINSYVNAVGLGIIAGMRSMAAPALLSSRLGRTEPKALFGTPFEWMLAPQTALTFSVLAVGEIVADKLPFVPARIEAGPLVGRMASGGLCGAAFCAAEGEEAVVGAAFGAFAALAAAFAFYQLRRGLGWTLKIPDALLAVAEDVLVFNLGQRILATPSSD